MLDKLEVGHYGLGAQSPPPPPRPLLNVDPKTRSLTDPLRTTEPRLEVRASEVNGPGSPSRPPRPGGAPKLPDAVIIGFETLDLALDLENAEARL